MCDASIVDVRFVFLHELVLVYVLGNSLLLFGFVAGIGSGAGTYSSPLRLTQR